MVKNTHLYVSKFPIFASILVNSYLDLKWKQTAEKENVYIASRQLLKWQQSVMLIKQQKRENLSLLLTKSPL